MEKMTRKQLAALSNTDLAARFQDIAKAIRHLNTREPRASAEYDALKLMQRAAIRESNHRMDAAAR